jgi:hypothetical protein
VAEKKAADLAPRLPYLTVTVVAPAPGLEIMRGDDHLGPGSLGSAVPLDPGSYVVVASAPGYRAWKTTINVAEAETKTVVVPALEPEAPPQAEAVQAPPAPQAPALIPLASPPETPAAESSTHGSGTTLGWILGGSGVVALGVGAGFGIASLVSYHDASVLCPLHQGCSADAMSDRNSAEWKAWVSNIALGVGVVGVGFGGWILLSNPHREHTTRLAFRVPNAAGMRLSLEQSF